MKRILLVGQPKSSSGFLTHTITALEKKGCELVVVDAHALFWPKVWPTLRGYSLDKDTWYRRRWENNLYSTSAWMRNTRLNGRLIDRIRRPDDVILQMGKEYFPHPAFRDMKYFVFVQSCLANELAGGVSPWIPRKKEQPAFMALERELYQHATKVFVGAEYMKKYMHDDYGVKPEHLAYGGGGADDYFIGNMPEAPASVIRKNMIMVGWDYLMKGGPTAVEALTIARKTIPDLTLTMVGPPVDEPPDVPGLIKIGPLRDRARLLALYREADVFVLPTLYDTFGFVFCEAMSQGLPCIATDFNAIPELIEPGVNGYLFSRKNAQALANKILEFYADPSNRVRMGAAAMKLVRQQYTWPLVAKRLLDEIA